MKQIELIADRLERIEALLLEIKNGKIKQSPFIKDILDMDELVEYTGYAPSYIYKLTSGGIIPFSKPHGKKLFFDRKKIDEWRMSWKQPSSAEIEIKANTKISIPKLSPKY